MLVDELATIIRIYTEELEGEVLSNAVHGRTYPGLPFTPYRKIFRPAAGNVYGAECIQVKTFHALTAMSHQVNFKESWLILLPIGKGPDGYGVLEQVSWSGGT